MPAPNVISSKSGIVWPALPAPGDAALLSLLFQLQQTEWWSPDRLEAHQFGQLQCLLEHAWRTAPFYRERLSAAAYEPGSVLEPAAWRRIEPLTRADLQAAGDAPFSTAPPSDHGEVGTASSSGSTGRPVTVRTTGLANRLQRAFVLRNHRWQGLDISGSKAVIRTFDDPRTSYPDGLHAKGWGRYIDSVFSTGSVALLHIATSAANQAEWLRRVDPDYLLTYPNNLLQLARHCADSGIELPRLKSIETMSEALPEDIRDVVRDAWNVPLYDIYSAEEVGMIAAQCPETDNYHIVAEGVRVEVLDARDRPCKPGQVGRVVVTPLHNFAAPLIRYEIGDYAEAGDGCPCGRGLPVLRRIIGRTRNMMVGPDGERFRPSLGSRSIAKVAPVLQFQLVQRRVDHIEFRLVTARALSAAEETVLGDLIRARIGYPMRVSFSYRDEIARGAGGKFEDFISEVAD